VSDESVSRYKVAIVAGKKIEVFDGLKGGAVGFLDDIVGELNDKRKVYEHRRNVVVLEFLEEQRLKHVEFIKVDDLRDPSRAVRQVTRIELFNGLIHDVSGSKKT
jgi:predicted transport protein